MDYLKQKYGFYSEFFSVCKMLRWTAGGEVRAIYNMGYGPNRDQFFGTTYKTLKDPNDEDKVISTTVLEKNVT